MALALIGIISLQVHWISKGVRIEDRQFEKQVFHALAKLVERLEQEDMDKYIVFATTGTEHGIFQGQTRLNRRLDTFSVTNPKQGGELMRIQHEQRGDKITIRLDGNVSGADSTMWMQRFMKHRRDTSEFLEQEMQTFRHWTHNPMFPGDITPIEQMLTRSLQFVISPQRGLQDRITQERLDTLLKESLADVGINLNHQYLVYSEAERGYVYATGAEDDPKMLATPYRVRLYPNSRMSTSYLFLDFPNQGLYAWGQIWGIALASLLFTGIILFCFWYVIKTILRQKKLSEMKSDFINNMTHEFKTPLATISLATDALKSPMIRESDERMAYYTRIIKEENQGMNQLVERVLQIARSEIKLRPISLNVNNIIEKAVENIRLHVEQRDGHVDFVLDAENPIIQADEVHLTNLISNLLDNANKYSPDAPQITVSSWEEEGWLAISISDKGQGISKADQEKIFDRFFRVSTGNLHDVKGFGLGLSYVKEIVEAHGGLLSLNSKLGEGSTFIVRLPKGGEG
jgi:two-component system phosphate regulon sensor histidine kinase PhoR